MTLSPLRQRIGLFLALTVFLICARVSPAQVRGPNIVFLLADDLGYGDLGCFGSPVIRSPHLDRLATEGVRLTQCYAASPNCSPARTGILTGRSPYRVGMYDFARFEALHIPKSEITLATLLQSHGYQTMFAGKWQCSGDFSSGKQPYPGDHGFDHWLANASNFGRDPTGFLRNGKKAGRQSGWMSEIVVDEAIRWLDERDRSRPFFTCLWFSEPHPPVVAAEEFRSLYRDEQTATAARKLAFGGPQVIRRRAKWEKRELYFGCVSMLDHHIGRLLAHLDERGLREDTIVVFTSDNGPEHRTDTAFGSPGRLRGAKGHLHDGGIHVPGIVRWPKRIQAATVSEVPVNGTDWLPTLARTAGIAPPGDLVIDGADVFPAIIAGRAVERPCPMMWWLWHARGGHEVAMRIGDYKVLASMAPQRDLGAISDARQPAGWSIMRFIKEAELANFTMYDLRADPSERNDLASKESERFEEMKRRMIELHREIRAEGPVYDLSPRKKREPPKTRLDEF